MLKLVTVYTHFSNAYASYIITGTTSDDHQNITLIQISCYGASHITYSYQLMLDFMYIVQTIRKNVSYKFSIFLCLGQLTVQRNVVKCSRNHFLLKYLAFFSFFGRRINFY
jgi:hypothetical protein